MIRNPELRDKPLGVQQKYIVVTCNYEARRLGVNKLMSVREAKEKCPQLVLVSGEDLTPYRETSYRVTELLEEFSPKVERLGFDENFIDVTELVDKKLHQEYQSNINQEALVSGHVYNGQTVNVNDWSHVRIAAGSHIAADIRAALHHRLGLTGCAGVASNKLLAKLVSGTFKPNQQTVLLHESHSHLINSLDHVKKIPGIGYKTTQRLEALGLSSISDLQTCPFKLLEKELGASVALRIQMLSRGEDNSPVTPSGPPQSISDEDSFKKCSTISEVKMKMRELLTSLLIRLTKDGRRPHTLRLTIRQFSPTNKWFNRESRQCPIPTHIIQNIGSECVDVISPLMELLMRLFEKMINVKLTFHLTLLNVCFSNLKASDSTRRSIGFYLTQKTPSTATTNYYSQEAGESTGDCLYGKDDSPASSEVDLRRTGQPTSPVYTKDTDNTQSASLLENIDMDVFNQLPEDIRKEILSSPGVKRVHRSSQSSLPLAPKGILNFFTKVKVGPPAANHRDEDNSLPEKSTRTSLTNHLDDVNILQSTVTNNKHTESTVSKPEKSAGSATSLAHTSSDNTCNRDTSLQSDDTVVDHESAMDCNESQAREVEVSFPKSVDVNVFAELPVDLQKELMTEWKQKKHTPKIQVKKQPEKAKATKGRRTPSSTEPTGLLKYFKPS
ncbi:DNA polymerase iota [Rhinophrynus dorsalis]